MSADLTLRSRHVVTPTGVVDAVVRVAAGRIVAIGPGAIAPADSIDIGARWLLPGLVDTHVHIDDPGHADWEGFETATCAAAAGGITTLVDMPLNSIPVTTSVEALAAKHAAARGRCQVDVGFWGGVVPGNVTALEGLAAGGVLGFKCFMAPSGLPEFEHVGELELAEAMPAIARLGLPLLAHAESPAALDRAAATRGRDPRAHSTWLASRPPEAEVEAIELLIRLTRATRCRVHIVHLAAAAAVPLLRAARAEGLPITVETCPHYLTFDAGEVRDGATEFKCAPPLRERANREALWRALGDGDIDLIASDHSPCPPVLKCPETGSFLDAWGGIASLELSLSAVWTAARARGLTPLDVVRWMSATPARLAGLAGQKGAIAPGADADLVVFDPDHEFVAEPGRLRQRHRVTPYAGRRLLGRIERVYLRGECVFDGERFPGEPAGHALRAVVDAPARRP